MDNEIKRLNDMFGEDGKYYKFSITNRQQPLTGFALESIFNEYRRYKWIIIFLLTLNKNMLKDYKVLDTGCGTGKILEMFRDYVKVENLYGIDLSPTVIECAKRRCGQMNFSVAPLIDLPFERKQFDILLNMGVIMHILDDDYIRQASKEFRRVIKDDGVLFLLVSNERYAIAPAIRDTTRCFDTNKKEIEKLFEEDWTVKWFKPIYTDCYLDRNQSSLNIEAIDRWESILDSTDCGQLTLFVLLPK